MTAPADRIRMAGSADLPLLPGIEASSDADFRALGMAAVADSTPAAAAAYAPAALAGRVWVAVDERDAPVGFLRLEIVDGTPHVAQLSVLPDHRRRGLGGALLARAASWAGRYGYPRLTLRTFRDVPFNGPYYARLGWRPVPDEETGPELADLRADEERLGLSPWPRQTMTLDVRSSIPGRAAVRRAGISAPADPR